MQRPIGDAHMHIAMRCRRLGVPLWIDYDDLLSEVPDDNKTHQMYEGAKHTLNKILDHATIITTSTRLLAEKLAELGGNKYMVIPNALDPMFGKIQFPSDGDGVAWRGSYLHERDLLSVRQGIFAAWKKCGKPFTFMGMNPWFLSDIGMKFSSMQYGDIVEYFGMLMQRHWRVFFVALHDSEFNRCKSAIAYIEATFAGAAVVAPDFPEWRLPGVMTYTTEGELCDHIALLAGNETLARENWGKAAAYINENLLLEKVNEIRWELIKGFLMK